MFNTSLKNFSIFYCKNNKAFSLVEISLVIIAVGIILSIWFNAIVLIKNVRIKSVIKQIREYNIAVDNFESKYGALPGDINKTVLFGLSEKETNGDLNGNIEDSLGFKKDNDIVNNSIKQFSGEIANFWLHLSNSEFLPGRFDGKIGTNAILKKSFPSSKLSKVGIVAFGIQGINYFQIGLSSNNNVSMRFTDFALRPLEAFVIDKKLDDGFPLTGLVRAVGGDDLLLGHLNVNKNCVNLFEYNIKLEKPFCQLRIVINK